MKSPFTTFFSAIALAAIPASSLFAASNASDTAGNYGTTYISSNNGTGFGGYTFSSTGSVAGTFIGDSTTNGSGGGAGINTVSTAKSFGLFANSGSVSLVNRLFTSGGPNGTTALAINQTFSLKLDTGFIDSGNTEGFNLFNGSGTQRFTFQFAGGGTNYTYSVGGSQIDTGVPFTANGLTVALTQRGSNAFSLAITPSGGGTTTITGTLAAPDISQLQVFNNNAGNGNDHNFFFNDPTITITAPVPEPMSAAASAIVAIAACTAMVRRRVSRAAV